MVAENIFSVKFALCFLFATLVAFYLVYRYAKNKKSFRWIEYFGILLVPAIFVITLASIIGPKVYKLFLVSSIVGLALEYSLGVIFHKAFHRRLWVYDSKHNINKYTSWFVLPVWGAAGVIFWFIAKRLGL